MIASGRILAVSALTDSASSAFTTTPSTPFSRSTFFPASLLVIPITSCLAATSAATNGLPIAPLAPATNTFIDCDLRLSENCWQNAIQSRAACGAALSWVKVDRRAGMREPSVHKNNLSELMRVAQAGDANAYSQLL